MGAVDWHPKPKKGHWPRPGPAPWGAGAGEQAHDRRQVVAGDVDQVAFLDVVAAAQPGSAHAAAVEGRRGRTPLAAVGRAAPSQSMRRSAAKARSRAGGRHRPASPPARPRPLSRRLSSSPFQLPGVATRTFSAIGDDRQRHRRLRCTSAKARSTDRLMPTDRFDPKIRPMQGVNSRRHPTPGGSERSTAGATTLLDSMNRTSLS